MTADSIKIFDRDILKQRLSRNAPNFHQHDFLHEWVQKNIDERLGDIKRTFSIRHALQPDSLNTAFEALGLQPESFDLVTSALNLHSVNDLPGVLHQIRTALKPDGLFLGAMFGGETLHELRESLMQTELALKGGVSPRVFPFADKQQAGALLQRARFALPVVDSEILRVTYDNMFKLMHDLRGMGESNIIAERSRTNPGKEFFTRAAEHYTENFAEDDGRIVASFEIIFMIGWSPHESQQQPLKPGSAEKRLADALDTQEMKTGERP